MNTISCNVDQLIQGVLYNAVDLVAMSSSEIVNIIQCRVDEKPRAGHNIAKIIERRIRGRRGCSCEIECLAVTTICLTGKVVICVTSNYK